MLDITQIVTYTVLFVSLYFEVFLLITFFEHPTKKSTRNTPPALSDSKLPTATVIVPCWNEERTVAATLDSLLALNYPKHKLSIIAVNDGSTDGTQAILDTYNKYPQITIFTKENGGKHSAMNAALRISTSEIIGCLDADSFVEQDALMFMATHFTHPEVSAVTPSIKIHNARSVLQILQKAEYSLAIFVRNVFAHMDALFITPGPFSFFRRSDIVEVGPWRHGHNTEDLEMCLRLQSHHKKVTNEPSAVVYTTAPKTFMSLYHQRVRWTFGFLRNAYDYIYLFGNPKYGTLGMFVLPLSIFSIFSTTFLFVSLLWNSLLYISSEFVRFKTIGISTIDLHPSLFYIHTSVMTTMVITLTGMTIALIIIGKYISNDKLFSFDTAVYLVLYGFITPLWLVGSLYKVATQRSVRWR